jgi:hypothetical protein
MDISQGLVFAIKAHPADGYGLQLSALRLAVLLTAPLKKFLASKND